MLAGRLSVPTNPGTNILSAGETFEREKSAKDSQKIPSKSEIVIFCFLVNYLLIFFNFNGVVVTFLRLVVFGRCYSISNPTW